ncbi:MAG: hypothetical protein ABIR57_03865 [Aeromicrobium sp.]
MEDGGDRRIIDPGSSQSVELVDDDVGNVAFANTIQHPLQTVAVSRTGRGSSIDELLGHYGAEFVGFALAGVPLSGNGVPLGLTVLGGLPNGRDPQIYQRVDRCCFQLSHGY